MFYLGALSSDCLTVKKVIGSEAQGRCLFRYMPPRISEIHTFTDSVFLFECVLQGEGCVAFVFHNVRVLDLNSYQGQSSAVSRSDNH